MTDFQQTFSAHEQPEIENRHKGPIILMYHGTPKNTPSSQYSLRSSKFLKHIQYLKNNGWHTASIKNLSDPESLHSRTVMITFDDGYANNYEGAFTPLLEKNMVATWFITTDSIGGYADWLGARTPESKMLESQQIIEMSKSGMEIGSHTCSHPDLQTLSYPQQLVQFTTSKNTLESFLDMPVTSFAYPYGRYSEDSLKALSIADYKFACTTRPGWFSSEKSNFLIRRVTIFSSDSASVLSRKLTFADNDVSWKKLFIYYKKRLGSRILSK